MAPMTPTHPKVTTLVRVGLIKTVSSVLYLKTFLSLINFLFFLTLRVCFVPSFRCQESHVRSEKSHRGKNYQSEEIQHDFSGVPPSSGVLKPQYDGFHDRIPEATEFRKNLNVICKDFSPRAY